MLLEDNFLFSFKGIVVAYIKIKYINQITSNHGDLNMGEIANFMSISCFCDIDLDLKEVMPEL